jgi:hypothetical protein
MYQKPEVTEKVSCYFSSYTSVVTTPVVKVSATSSYNCPRGGVIKEALIGPL